MVDGKLTYTTPSALENLIREGKEVRDITAEDITKGYDQSKPASILSALQKNEVLRYVAASDAAGRLMLSASQVEEAALSGSTIRNQVDLNRFIEETNKSPEKRAALGKELGIQENEWDTLQLGRFNEAIRAYRESGKADAYKHKIEIIEKAKAIPEGDAKKKMPNALTLGDGMIRRYKTEKADIAIARDGSSYMLYDYNSGDTSRSLTRAEANTLLHELKAAGEVNIPTDGANTPENAENSALKNQNQGNMGVTSENSLKTSEKTSEISLSPNARRAVAITEDGKVYVQASRKVINGTTKAEQRKEISNFFSRLLDGGKSLDIHTLEGDVLTITKKDTARKARDDYKTEKGKPVRMTDEEFSVKMRIESHIDEVAEISKKKKGGQEDSKTHDFAKAGFTYRKAYFEDFDGQYYEVTLSIGHNGTVATVYNVGKIKESVSPSAKVIAVVESKAPWETLSKDSIPNSGEKVNTSEQNSSEKSTKERIAEVRERLDAKKIDKYVTENVEEYSSFGEQNKSMIRKVVREGRANGLDDADILSYARVAARSGLNVEFDTAMKDGEAGYFDPDKNRIVINPKTTKKHELLLIHELDHAVRAYIGNDGKIHYLAYKDADKKVSEKTRKHIKEHYADQEIDVSREELYADESSAYYSEAILGGDKFIDLLLGKEPTLKDKILSFFTGAAQSYSKDPELAKAARAHYRSFKKMFADFAERNKGRNAETAVDNGKSTVESEKSARYSLATTAELEVDDVLENKFHKDFVKLTDNTPSILLAQKGVRNLPLHMKPTHVRENILTEKEALAKGYKVNDNINYHGLGKKKFLEVIADLDNVREAYRGTKNAEKAERRENYFLLISTIKDAEGNIINVPIYINEHADYHNVMIDTNKVATVFGRSGLREYINKEIRNGNLVKIKNRSLQAGDAAAPIAAPYDVNASSNSIPQTAEKSTTSAKKTSETSKSQRKSTNFEATLADDHEIASVAGRDAKAGAKRASRFSKRATDMTVGQLRQMVARYTGEKVYSSKEARETIDEIYGVFSLSGKNRAKLYEAMWQGYNTCRTDNERAEFSFDMAEYVTVMLLSESSVANPDRSGIQETLTKLKRGIGHLVFDDIETGDLKHALDRDGWRKFYSRWGFRETAYKNRRRYPLDEFITDFASDNEEYSYLKDMTPQDAILELDRIYEQTVDASKRTVGALEELSDSEIRDMIADVGTAIYESFSTKGEKSTAKKVIEAKIASVERKYSKLKGKYDELSRKYYEEQSRPMKLLNLSYQIRKMKDLQLGTFLNSTDYKNEIFEETFETLGSIEFRGNISPEKVRKAMQRLSEWYKPDNPVLKEMDGVPGSMLYSDYIALAINDIASGEGKLTMHELELLDNVLRHATRMVENFNRIWKNGKWQDASATAKSFVEVANTTTRLRSSADIRKFTRLFESAKRWYLTSFGDPMTVFRYMDGYQDGFFTWAGEELRAGAFRHGVDVMEMKTEYDAFLKDRKGYLKKASLEAVEYGGAKMSKLQYISLYMTMQREQAQRGLAFNGFSLIDLNGRRVEVDGFISRVETRLGAELGISKDPDGTWQVSDEQMKRAVDSEISEMKKKLTADDLQFVEIIERTLNGKCKELKTARDMERLGFSNTISGYYYPIVRAMIARTIDSRSMWGELDRASNISANKNTVRGAAGALYKVLDLLASACYNWYKGRHIEAAGYKMPGREGRGI